jgi:hypothetical protein
MLPSSTPSPPSTEVKPSGDPLADEALHRSQRLLEVHGCSALCLTSSKVGLAVRLRVPGTVTLAAAFGPFRATSDRSFQPAFIVELPHAVRRADEAASLATSSSRLACGNSRSESGIPRPNSELDPAVEPDLVGSHRHPFGWGWPATRPAGL